MTAALERLIDQVMHLRDQALAFESAHQHLLEQVAEHYRNSARNLMHYLALRQRDLRDLQNELAALGLSSLGRSESHTLHTLHGVLRALHCLAGHSVDLDDTIVPVTFRTGALLLDEHTHRLFGEAAGKRPVRIMVTMPSEGAGSILISWVGGALVADLIEPSRRASAYALLRMIANLGVAIGPAIGGFIVSASYSLAFALGGAAQILFALLVLLWARETRPQTLEASRRSFWGEGYEGILKDRPFLAFCGFYTLAGMAYSLMMVLLPVYVKENFGVPERLYGFIMTTNAAMVVAFQYGITRLAARFRELPVLVAGSLFYALGVGSVALGRSFPAFLFSMVLLTIGEMLMIPTATTWTANRAPVEARGRYMSVYGLTWGVGFGIGPVLGGMLHDQLGPAAIWWGGAGMALLGALGFLWLASRPTAPAPDVSISAQ